MGSTMEAKLVDAFPENHKIIVREDPGSCGSSWTVVVVTDEFKGVGLLDRQRNVNEILAKEIAKIHAITMKTWTTTQWAKHKDKYI